MSKQLLIDQLDRAITEILERGAIQSASVDASLTDLCDAASDLVVLPRPEFKAQLRRELERKWSMSATKPVQFRPGFRTVTPYLLSPSADFIDFAKHAFGAEETERTVTSPTSFHAELRIGDSMVMVGVGQPRPMPAELAVNVPNSDEVYQRALAAGAVSLEPMMEAHGLRFGCVQDVAGNQWFISTRLGGDYKPEHHHTITTCLHVEGAAKFIDFVRAGLGGTELERHEGPEGRVFSSLIRIGNSVIAVGDPGSHVWTRPMPTMMYLYVPDVDALYDQAIRAGAQSIHPPADQFYGDRSGGITDAWGNQWYMATPK
jgi:PhnB protein